MNKPIKKIVVTQNDENIVPVEIMAEAITAISAGIKRLRAGPLNDRCLLLLIQNACDKPGKYASPVSQKQIKAVLDGIAQLETEYLKPKGK